MVGQLATSKAGRDKGVLYVITAQQGDFVYLCDGRLRAPDRPKKKRIRHIQPIKDRVDEALAERLRRGERVYPEEIRYALKQYRGKAGAQEEQGAGCGAGEQEEQEFSCGRQQD